MFESMQNNPDEVPRIGQKLTKMNSPQVTHIMHHMFDGMTHNHTAATNGTIPRMRKDYPHDQQQQNPAAMGGGHCDGPIRQYDLVPPPPPNPHGPPDMGCLPGVGMIGMANYGDAFQMSANVQAEANMSEEERRRRYGENRMPMGAPPMNDFESSLNASKIPFRPPPQNDGNKSSAEENDEEDENDYEEEFEDTRTMEERQAGKPPPPRRKIAFNCFQCQKRYRSRKSLVRHHKKHPGFCADCGVRRGITLEEVIAHNTQNHIAQYPFVCEECGESFRRNQQFKDHQLAVHGRDIEKNSKDQPSICDICGDRFNSLQLLKKHVLKMHKQDAKKYGCKYCEKSFTLKSNLERHMRLHTEVQKGFICEKCGAEYFSSQALKDHCNQAHVEMKPFECDFCKKRFSHQRSLRKHAQSHSEERPFVCDICVQAFKHKTHLVRHRQSVHHEQPAKKKFKRMQENNKGELIPVVEAPRTKTPSGKASTSTSKNKQPDGAPAIDGPPKHYQSFPDNNMFYNQPHDYNNPASTLPPNTSVPMQPQHNPMLGYVNQPGRPQSQQSHQIPQPQHMQHPHQPHQPHLHPSIPNGPHPPNHHHMQHHPPPHHPHPHQNPMHQHHPQFHPQHLHHQQQPHHIQQPSPMQMQPSPHLQSQSPHLVPPHRQMPTNAYVPALDSNHQLNNHFAMNNNNNSNNSNANMYQPQQQQQHFQPNSTPNHDHFQTSYAFKTEPQQPPQQHPPPQIQQQQQQQPLPIQQQQPPQHHPQQHNHHQVPSSNSPHMKLETFSSDSGSRPGSNYAASSYDQSNNWNMNVPPNTPHGPSGAPHGPTTNTPAGPPDTTRNTASSNKMFSMVEVNSGEYMKVDMPPPFTKQELNDVDLLQYQNLWGNDSNNTQQQQQHMNYIEPPSTNSYNNIGSILSNLELLGNNAGFDSNSFEIITSNFDQAQQQQQQQAPQQPIAQPNQVQPPIAQQHQSPQHQQQQQHQPQQHQQPPIPSQLQPQTHLHPHQMHLQRQHSQQHPHHPGHLPPHAGHPNKPPLNHPGHMGTDPNMSYYNNPSPMTPTGPPQTSIGYSTQPPHGSIENNNSINYPNHTITDISNTFLTENQRNNLQQHVDYMQPTTSTAMSSPSSGNGNFYGPGGGAGPIRNAPPTPVPLSQNVPPKQPGAPDPNNLPSLTEYLHNPM